MHLILRHLPGVIGVQRHRGQHILDVLIQTFCQAAYLTGIIARIDPILHRQRPQQLLTEAAASQPRSLLYQKNKVPVITQKKMSLLSAFFNHIRANGQQFIVGKLPGTAFTRPEYQCDDLVY